MKNKIKLLIIFEIIMIIIGGTLLFGLWTTSSPLAIAIWVFVVVLNLLMILINLYTLKCLNK